MDFAALEPPAALDLAALMPPSGVCLRCSRRAVKLDEAIARHVAEWGVRDIFEELLALLVSMASFL